MRLERLQQAAAGTITAPFTQDGVPTDPTPDAATVTLTRDSTGATLGPYDCYDGGEGVFTHTLNPTETALLDGFTAAWTATFDTYEQSFTTRVEVVGGFVFTLAQARADRGLGATNNDSTYRVSQADLVAMRTEVERRLEGELGFAMVPRYTQETLDGYGTDLRLAFPYVRSIRTATVSDVAATPADIVFDPTGGLYYPAGFTTGRQNVVVGYEHGMGSPPAGAVFVALALAKRWLLGSPADDRATSMSTEEQTTTFYVPGSDEPFDVPAANRFVRAHSLRVGLA